MGTTGSAFWKDLRICTRACEGDPTALRRVSKSERLLGRALELGLGPSLALAEKAVMDRSMTPSWREALRASSVGWLVVDGAASDVRRGLSNAAVAWAPFKGYDVGTRAYSIREQRPTKDLDLLVEPVDFDLARRELVAAGWRAVTRGQRRERFLRQEGYAWQAARPNGGVLELHFRLWGLVPEGIVAELLQRAVPDPKLGASALRLSRAHAYLLAAVHAWTNPRPRTLLDWMDLSRLAPDSGENLTNDILDVSLRWSLELPVCMSAGVADRLWPAAAHRKVAEQLLTSLRPAERRVYDQVVTSGFDAISYRRVVLARLLSGRPSRMGWRSIWRSIWTHPGTVEKQTPEDWWWPRRRWSSVVRNLRRVLR